MPREIPPGGDFVCGQLGRDFVGFLLHLFGIGIRKVVFGQDRMHFGVVVTRSTQYVDNLTRGIFIVSGHSVTRTSTF